MVLGFKRQFAPFVRDGSKTHSIREDKNDRWKVGVIVDAFVDPRQKTMERLLPSTPCVKTEAIIIVDGFRRDDGELKWFSAPLYVELNGIDLSPEEVELLFYRDGFRKETGQQYQSTKQAAEFWKGRLPFKGKLIHWKYPLLAGREQVEQAGKRTEAKP